MPIFLQRSKRGPWTQFENYIESERKKALTMSAFTRHYHQNYHQLQTKANMFRSPQIYKSGRSIDL